LIDIKDRREPPVAECERTASRMGCVESTSELIVDARGLEPPEPMDKALAGLASLAPGQRMRFKIHREPYPLYRILQQNDYAWQVTQDADGNFEILIWEKGQRVP
jgi:hypothetical protein